MLICLDLLRPLSYAGYRSSDALGGRFPPLSERSGRGRVLFPTRFWSAYRLRRRVIYKQVRDRRGYEFPCSGSTPNFSPGSRLGSKFLSLPETGGYLPTRRIPA